MEFTKDIYFDKNPKQGKVSKITYSGELFKNGSGYVNIVYGFGDNWESTTTVPMKKDENGFTAEVEMKDYDKFNFCFSNENNNWDNNNFCNYLFSILPDTPSDDNQSETKDYTSSIDDIIEDILENTIQNSPQNQDSNTSDDNKNADDIFTSIATDSLPEIEQLFAELFDGVDIDEVEGKIQNAETATPEPEGSIETVKTELSEEAQLAELAKEIDGEKTEIIPEENIKTDNTYDEASATEELLQLFNELFETGETPVGNKETEYFENDPIQAVSDPENEDITANLNVSNFNLDGLVSDILEPVVSQTVSQAIVEPEETSETENSLFENVDKIEKVQEENNLPILKASDELSVSSRKLGTFYKFKKKVKIAFYKLFVKVPQELAKQLGFGKE